MLQLLDPSNERWAAYFLGLPINQQDIFYSPDYAELCARYIQRVGRPLCAVLEDDSSYIMYPFLQRSISSLGNFEGIISPEYQDITGLYGRGGLVCSEKNGFDVSSFHGELQSYCNDSRIICGFDRYHPIVGNHGIVGHKTKVFDIGGFVVVNLSRPISEIEAEFTHAVRKNIKKATRAGCSIFSEVTLEHLDDFMAVYSATLARNHAADFYYLPEDFYRDLPSQMEGKYRFFYTELAGRVVSCELVLFHGIYCHSFLGGTLEGFGSVCPNHMLKREIIRFAQESGCQYYLLGGGTKPYDGIWSYKNGFSPEGTVASHIGGTIFDDDAYLLVREALVGGGIPVNKERIQFYDQISYMSNTHVS